MKLEYPLQGYENGACCVLSHSPFYSFLTEKIRVGRDYQAVCPPLVPELDRRPELMNERALLVWSPTKEIPDMKRKFLKFLAPWL